MNNIELYNVIEQYSFLTRGVDFYDRSHLRYDPIEVNGDPEVIFCKGAHIQERY